MIVVGRELRRECKFLSRGKSWGLAGLPETPPVSGPELEGKAGVHSNPIDETHTEHSKTEVELACSSTP